MIKKTEKTESKALTGKIVQINKNISIIRKESEEIKVRNTNDLNLAVEFLSKIRNWKKRVEEVRLSFTKPLNESLRNINAEFKKTSEHLNIIDKEVNNKILEYRRKEAEKIRIKQEKEAEKQRIAFEKEQERKKKELEKQKKEMTKKEVREKEKEIEKEEFIPTPTIVQEKKIGTDKIKMTTKKYWTFEIEDETKIPRKYMKIDEVAIGKAVRSEGVREIRGVRIFQKESLV